MDIDPAGEQAEEIFCAASGLSEPAERLAFLDQACAGNASLRAAVETLLAELGGFLEFYGEGCRAMLPLAGLSPAPGGTDFRESVQAILSAKEEAGRQVGPYKLLERIGEGGCGVVYMAEQTLPVQRNVALKLIKLGMDTKRVIARFELERQAMALMDHPNIARVLDAGATELGRPFVVMELVQGIKITTYCDQERLTVRQRLGMFVQVCHAIQHAHQKGIIHRDIKPSNILIITFDGQPVPKVIDFGIAKATGGLRLADNTVFTACDQFVGTPAYMSPEQTGLSRSDVDTRSDIYSLGVLLYELLTGRTPFEPKELLESGLDAMRRRLCDEEPLRPSIKLSRLQPEELTQTAMHRRVELRRLKSLLSGDLDWIVMKALEKERSRRYQTANGLAMDVQRYLDNEVVEARPPSRLYRLHKMVRRNRTTFLAICAVSLAMITGLGASAWMYIRERRALQEQSRLRSEAEIRVKIARAALLVNRGETTEADQLLEKIDLPATGVSLEAEELYRSMGRWHALHGHWPQAAHCLLQLFQATKLDETDLTDRATADLLGIGSALVAAGQLERYRQLVQEASVRFARTDNPTAAEQVLKFSAITEMDQPTVEALKPVLAVLNQSISKAPQAGWETYLMAWRVFTLSLFEYRRGNYTSAITWGKRSLACPDPCPSRVAMTHLVLAMAYGQIHQTEAARTELAQGRELTEQKLPRGLEGDWFPGMGDCNSGFWHEWVMAYVLLREASSLQGHWGMGGG